MTMIFHLHKWMTVRTGVCATFTKNNWPEDTSAVIAEGNLQQCRCQKQRFVPYQKNLRPVEVVPDSVYPRVWKHASRTQG